MRDAWHRITEGGCFTMARRLPVRFDVAASARFPVMRKERLALQVRQDMWRVLQKLRGFSPVVRVCEVDGALEVTAGGAVEGAFPKAQVEARLAEMLADPERRARWTRWAGVVALALITGAPVGADPVAVEVPSGEDVALAGVLLDEAPGALWARFRFVAPELGAGFGPDAAAGDMDHLCAAVAVPYLSHHGIEPARIVISIADRELPFGKKAPEATQYFEAYRLESGGCIWEAF